MPEYLRVEILGRRGMVLSCRGVDLAEQFAEEGMGVRRAESMAAEEVVVQRAGGMGTCLLVKVLRGQATGQQMMRLALEHPELMVLGQCQCLLRESRRLGEVITVVMRFGQSQVALTLQVGGSDAVGDGQRLLMEFDRSHRIMAVSAQRGQAVQSLDLDVVVVDVLRQMEGRLETLAGGAEVAAITMNATDPDRGAQVVDDVRASGRRPVRRDRREELTSTWRRRPPAQGAGGLRVPRSEEAGLRRGRSVINARTTCE